MKIIILFAVTALIGYIMGYVLGRYTAEQEIYEMRSEMDLDPEPEDIFSKMFKE